MNYLFPKIHHLDDVKPHIKGSDEFIIAEREWGFVVNYLINKEDTFPEVKTSGGNHKMREEATYGKAIRRECRGLKFDKNGFILARPYHKFFNINEKNETKLDSLDFSKKHILLEKLDGSMIHPIKVDAHYDKDHVFRMCSKMGITDVSMNAEVFISKNTNYHNFIVNCLKENVTPIFEWCSRKNRIVIDYPEDRLVLTAIRENSTGKYYSYESMKNISKEMNIDLVQEIEIEDIRKIVEFTKDKKDLEGYVIRFDDGHMLKIKADDYLRMHKAKDSLTHEKNVIYVIFNDLYDDFRSALHGTDRERMDKFYNSVMNDFNNNVKMFVDKINQLKREYNDRKTFALNAKVPDTIRKLMFTFWEKDHVTHSDILSELKELILRNCGTQTSIDKVRHLWNNHNWNYGASDE